MEICKGLPKIKNKTAISIGKFDGVHLGHNALIEELVLTADLNELESVVLTFNPYPEEYFAGKEIPHLSTRGEMISLMEEIGVDRLVTLDFDEHIANLSARDFVKDILIDKLNVSVVVCGSDVTFGKDKEGNSEFLEKISEEFGFDVEIIDKIEYNKVTVSSSEIIKALREGRMEDASEMLGYDYYHYGKVVKGQGLAHQFHLPTVNINPVEKRVLPKYGVYLTVVETEDGSEFHAVSNVGCRPTVSDEKTVNIESHMIDCPEGFDFYDKRIRVYFLKFLREEKKFDNVSDLFKQIGNDVDSAKRFFNI